MDLRSTILGALLSALLLCAAAPVPAPAEVDIDLGASVRWRPESERELVRPGGQLRVEARQLLRTRLRADFAPNQRTQLRLHIQDARVLGDPASGRVSADTQLGVHEAYLKVGDFFVDGLALQAGRFEMNYGNQRLIGAVGFSNPGRTFDAVRLTLGEETTTFDVFGAKMVHRQTGHNADTSFYGANARFGGLGAEGFVYWDYDGRQYGSDEVRRLNRWTAGAYAQRNIGSSRFDYVFNLAGQFGSFADSAEVDTMRVTYFKRTINAYLVTAELGYTFADENRIRLAGGLDFASGDDPNDVDLGTFNNLYYTGHKFRGFMDQFLLSNAEGLVDLYGRFRMRPRDLWSLGLDFHYFQTHREYTSQVSSSMNEKIVGMEVDAILANKQIEHVDVELVGAVFLPAEDWAGRGNDHARYWGYLQVMVKLP
jgi:hypothetical protein